MHTEALAWLTTQTEGLGPQHLVVDVGGRDINGTVRPLVNADSYIAVDLHPGPCVDVVADIRDWEPPEPANLVFCAEVLEHAPDAAGVVAACYRLLRPSGLLLLTAAAPPRGSHSAIDGSGLRPGEHYANIDPDELETWLADWSTSNVEYHAGWGDVYARATR